MPSDFHFLRKLAGATMPPQTSGPTGPVVPPNTGSAVGAEQNGTNFAKGNFNLLAHPAQMMAGFFNNGKQRDPSYTGGKNLLAPMPMPRTNQDADKPKPATSVLDAVPGINTAMR